MPYVPNVGQTELIDLLSNFVVDRDPDKVFLLRGYAGTGKTSLIAALVRAMQSLQQPTTLLAPTGRAAKVLSRHSEFPAFTIHKRIYRQDKLGYDTFSINTNDKPGVLYIVDEASMIANTRGDNAVFGTGCLLDDLIHFVYSSAGCALILIGDDAQLPPVGQIVSPALDANCLTGYGLHVSQYCLTEVTRQALDSGILSNATAIRELITEHAPVPSDKDLITSKPDVVCVGSSELLEQLEQSLREVGTEETIVLTRTNKRTNMYNQGFRARILWKEDQLSNGDRLMVSKNNYFWTEKYENLGFLANGDMLEIARLHNFREIYGYHFVDASLRSIDYDWEIDSILWVDTLFTDTPEVAYSMQKELFARIAEDYPEIHNRRDLVKAVYASPYYNALQVRFAYAVTCHKAQGGQWAHVYIDRGMLPDEGRNIEYLRWLYTAVTRATEKVFLVNFE